MSRCKLAATSLERSSGSGSHLVPRHPRRVLRVIPFRPSARLPAFSFCCPALSCRAAPHSQGSGAPPFSPRRRGEAMRRGCGEASGETDRRGGSDGVDAEQSSLNLADVGSRAWASGEEQADGDIRSFSEMHLPSSFKQRSLRTISRRGKSEGTLEGTLLTSQPRARKSWSTRTPSCRSDTGRSNYRTPPSCLVSSRLVRRPVPAFDLPGSSPISHHVRHRHSRFSASGPPPLPIETPSAIISPKRGLSLLRHGHRQPSSVYLYVCMHAEIEIDGSRSHEP